MITYRIIPLATMMMKLDMGIFTYRMNYGVKIEVPTYTWLIEGSEERIIVDSGGDPSFAAKRGIEVKEIMSFEDALATQDLEPADIDIIIQTHLHWDHCGNSRQCRNARVLVQERELRFASDPHPVMANTYHKPLFEGLRFEPIKGPCKVVSGIQVVPAPGHTPGTQGVSVMTEKGRCMISGFCCLGENFPSSADTHGNVVVAPGTHTDPLTAYDSAVMIRDSADILIPQHDPAMAEMGAIP